MCEYFIDIHNNVSIIICEDLIHSFVNERKRGEKMKLTDQQVLAIKRKRGELDYSINDLASATKVSKWTLINIFKHKHRNVTSVTFKKLNDWLIGEYNHDLVKEVNR